MEKVGGILAIAGAASAVLSLMGRDLRILMWIDTWGEGVGWGIRIGLIVVGAAIWFMAQKGKPAEG